VRAATGVYGAVSAVATEMPVTAFRYVENLLAKNGHASSSQLEFADETTSIKISQQHNVSQHNLVCAGTSHGRLLVYVLDSKKKDLPAPTTLVGHSGEITDFAFVRIGDYRFLISSSVDFTLRVWSLDLLQCVAKWSGANSSVPSVECSNPDDILADKYIWCASDDTKLRVYVMRNDIIVQSEDNNDELASTKFTENPCIKQWVAHSNGITSMRRDVFGYIWTAGRDRTIRIWNPADPGALVKKIKTQDVPNCIHPAEKHVWVASLCKIRIFDAEKQELLQQVDLKGYVCDMVDVQDTVWVSCSNGSVQVYPHSRVSLRRKKSVSSNLTAGKDDKRATPPPPLRPRLRKKEPPVPGMGTPPSSRTPTTPRSRRPSSGGVEPSQTASQNGSPTKSTLKSLPQQTVKSISASQPAHASTQTSTEHVPKSMLEEKEKLVKIQAQVIDKMQLQLQSTVSVVSEIETEKKDLRSQLEDLKRRNGSKCGETAHHTNNGEPTPATSPPDTSQTHPSVTLAQEQELRTLQEKQRLELAALQAKHASENEMHTKKISSLKSQLESAQSKHVTLADQLKSAQEHVSRLECQLTSQQETHSMIDHNSEPNEKSHEFESTNLEVASLRAENTELTQKLESLSEIPSMAQENHQLEGKTHALEQQVEETVSQLNVATETLHGLKNQCEDYQKRFENVLEEKKKLSDEITGLKKENSSLTEMVTRLQQICLSSDELNSRLVENQKKLKEVEENLQAKEEELTQNREQSQNELHETRSELQETKENLEGVLHQREETQKLLHQAMDEKQQLSEELAIERQQLAKLHEENTTLTHVISTQQEHSASSNEQSARLLEEKSRLESTVQDLEFKEKERAEELQQKSEEQAQLENQLSDLQQENGDMLVQLQKVQTLANTQQEQHSKEKLELQNRIKLMENELTASTSQLDSLQEQLTTLEQRKTEMQTKLNAASLIESSFQEQITLLKSKNERLTQQLTAHEQESSETIQQLTYNLQQQSKAFEDSDSYLQQKKKEFEEKELELYNRELKLMEDKKEMRALSEDVSNREANIEEKEEKLANEIEFLAQKTREFIAEKKEVIASFEERDSQLTETETELKAKKESFALLETTIQTQKKDLEEKQAILHEESTRRMSSFEQEMKQRTLDHETRRKDLNAQMVKHKEDRTEFEQKQSSYELRVNQLQSMLDKERERTQNAEDAVENFQQQLRDTEEKYTMIILQLKQQMGETLNQSNTLETEKHVLVEGWMSKESNYLKQWNLRYIKVRANGTMSHGKSERTKDVLKEYVLRGGTFCENQRRSKPNCLQINLLNGTTIFISSKNRTEMLRYVRPLEKAGATLVQPVLKKGTRLVPSIGTKKAQAVGASLIQTTEERASTSSSEGQQKQSPSTPQGERRDNGGSVHKSGEGVQEGGAATSGESKTIDEPQ